MKKYLKSGFNTTQNIKLEAGTYSLVAYVKSLYGNTYTFALGYDGAQGVEWTEYDVDVVKNQLCKVWFTFTIREKITKLKPISSSFSASLPVYVADLQLTRGNVPVEAGASPLDFDEILDGLYDEIDLTKAIPYLAGEYKPNTDYIRTSNSYPIVSYGESGGAPLYYALIGGIGNNGRNKQPNLKVNEDTWENITSFKQVFTQVLFAEFAKLDSFVFHKGKMFSQEGTLRGVAGSYEYTDEDHEPNFEVEGASGKVKMKDAEVEGIINALGGTIGDLAVEPSGRIAMYIPNTTESRLTFRADDIPALQSLLSATVYGGDFTAGAGEVAIPQTGTSTQTLTGSTYISQTGSTIEITGGRLLTLTCDFQGIGAASVGATLYLMRGSSKIQTLGSAFVLGSGIQTDDVEVENITLEGMQSGTYTLMLEVSKIGTQITSGNATVGSGVKVEWNFNREGVRNFLFGLNGFLSFFSNNHIYFTETTGLDVRGKTNMPGLLGSASVIGGQLSNEWGRITSIATYTGGYRVTISNMEHSNYTVQITSHTTNQWRISTKTSSNFIILGTGDCDIAIMGNNY